jgi:hypothetical protein
VADLKRVNSPPDESAVVDLRRKSPSTISNELQLTQLNDRTSTKKENRKYDNSALKKINQPVASAAGFTA